ncbi:hypothetical protein I3843_12G071100 [Carya illinoinensis]|uniref:Uncharacterized protein n=2 Tax=Carya illinoinensis TaxID=32201 RepID=A0A8T1NYI5_CARIL|nr:uncharacterized protein LOC122289837 isoform X1 [Carya illinoinensis]KAG2676799.1 hypothetical protein I3760_12G069200 [Carya illinoinensis]KAG6633770.1 hypothetical protein CIPAW_12G071600 [Carya illinoinensis]KAG7952682.1 hypothetical protein I3843_12G071100 [Carya illinoinensis]
MIYMFLSEPIWDENGNDASSSVRISLLNELESVIWSLMMSGGRSEVRLWLCNTIAGIRSITSHHQCELFASLLRSKPWKRALASQLLQMIFEKRPQKAGLILAKKSYILKKFFRGNPRRILQWFSNFAAGGGLDHGKGAKALSQFAFVNRDICWEELEWKGKHGQSPAMVATKPHYFLDLDVQQTVENFLVNVPEFWSSNEFAESLKDGEILFIDRQFFVEYFVDLMYEEDSRDVWEVINEFLFEESFSSLCHHLLIILEERDLHSFLELLCKLLDTRMEPKDFGNSSYLFEVIISKCGDCGSIDQMMLLNAIITQGRQLRRFLHEEGGLEEHSKIKDIMSRIHTIQSNANSLVPIFMQCFKKRTIKAIKWLGLQAWVLYYILSEECHTLDSWELLFRDNNIGFRRSNQYRLLDHDELLEESGSDSGHKASIRVKHRRKEKRRKRRKSFGGDDSHDNELPDFDTTNTRGLQANAESWLLSIDGYSVSWSSVDLPEHLSKHCLSTWMKWVFAKWE